MDAPSLPPRVARPVGRRPVAAPVVAITQRPAPESVADESCLDFTEPARRPESAGAELQPEPELEPMAEPETAAEPVSPAPAHKGPAEAPASTPATTLAATTVPTPAAAGAGGLRTLVVVRNGVIDCDESTVQILDMDNLSGAGAHDLADALLALKGAGRSTIKETAFAELMAMFNTAIS